MIPGNGDCLVGDFRMIGVVRYVRFIRWLDRINRQDVLSSHLVLFVHCGLEEMQE